MRTRRTPINGDREVPGSSRAFITSVGARTMESNEATAQYERHHADSLVRAAFETSSLTTAASEA